METHIIVENEWIYHNKSHRHGDEKRESSYFLTRKEDCVGNETKDTRPQNRYLWTDQKREKSNTYEGEEYPKNDGK